MRWFDADEKTCRAVFGDAVPLALTVPDRVKYGGKYLDPNHAASDLHTAAQAAMLESWNSHYKASATPGVALQAWIAQHRNLEEGASALCLFEVVVRCPGLMVWCWVFVVRAAVEETILSAPFEMLSQTPDLDTQPVLAVRQLSLDLTP